MQPGTIHGIILILQGSLQCYYVIVTLQWEHSHHCSGIGQFSRKLGWHNFWHLGWVKLRTWKPVRLSWKQKASSSECRNSRICRSKSKTAVQNVIEEQPSEVEFGDTNTIEHLHGCKASFRRFTCGPMILMLQRRSECILQLAFCHPDICTHLASALSRGIGVICQLAQLHCVQTEHKQALRPQMPPDCKSNTLRRIRDKNSQPRSLYSEAECAHLGMGGHSDVCV